MAVSTTTASVSQAGNGVTVAISTGYYFISNAHLVVIDKVDATGVETTLTITTHYTVAGAGNPTGGTVTMVTAPALGHTTTVKRVVPQTQASRYINDDTFDVTNIEADFDRMTMLIQDLQRQVDLCPKYRDTDASPTTDLGAAVDRADKIWGFDSNGDFELVTDAATSAAEAAASALAAAASAAAASASASAAAASALAAAAVGNGVLTTKGDLVSYSTTAVRVAVGANDTVPFADSTATPGIAYKTIDMSTSRVTGTNPISKGGTGLTALGSALQQIRVNAGATALEYFTDTTPAFTASFTSSAQTITTAGQLVLAHSLGGVPKLVQCRLKNISAELNYSVNDEIFVEESAFSGAAAQGVNIVPDATNLTIRYGNTANVFVQNDKTSGNATSLDNTKWQLIVRAWL